MLLNVIDHIVYFFPHIRFKSLTEHFLTQHSLKSFINSRFIIVAFPESPPENKNENILQNIYYNLQLISECRNHTYSRVSRSVVSETRQINWTQPQWSDVWF